MGSAQDKTDHAGHSKKYVEEEKDVVNLYKCVTEQRKYPWSIGCFKAADLICAACEAYISQCKSTKLKGSKNKACAIWTLLYALYHAWDLPREKFEEVTNLEKQKLKEDEIPK